MHTEAYFIACTVYMYFNAQCTIVSDLSNHVRCFKNEFYTSVGY